MTLTRRQERADTAANWTTANPVLAAGEIGVETDTYKLKVGDGTAAWADLPYAAGGGGGDLETPTVVASASATGTTSSVSVTIPAGVEPGDFLVAFVGSYYGVAPANVPAGWTLAAYTAAGYMNVGILVKRAVGTEDGTTLTIPLDGGNWSVSVLVIRGANRVRDYVAWQATSGTALTTNRFTLRAGPPDLLLLFGAARETTGTVTVSPTGTSVVTTNGSSIKTLVVAADTFALPSVAVSASTSGLGIAAIAFTA